MDFNYSFALCCVFGIGLPLAAALWLLSYVARKRQASTTATGRHVEFVAHREPAELGQLIAAEIASRFPPSGILTIRVQSVSALGVVVQYGNSKSSAWEIRIDFLGQDPVRGEIYLRADSGLDVLTAPEKANQVIDAAVAAIRRADPRAAVHGR
ncbi:MAG: hypothetical protein QM804_04520 [Propionicimonas sp.]